MVRAVNFKGSNYLLNRYMAFSFPTPYNCGNVSYWYKANQLTDGVILL